MFINQKNWTHLNYMNSMVKMKKYIISLKLNQFFNWFIHQENHIMISIVHKLLKQVINLGIDVFIYYVKYILFWWIQINISSIVEILILNDYLKVYCGFHNIFKNLQNIQNKEFFLLLNFWKNIHWKALKTF